MAATIKTYQEELDTSIWKDEQDKDKKGLNKGNQDRNIWDSDKKIQPIFLHSLGYWTLQKQDEERIIKAEISCQWVTEDHRVF